MGSALFLYVLRCSDNCQIYMQISGNYKVCFLGKQDDKNKLNGSGWSPMTAGFYENDGEHIISIKTRLVRKEAINI